MDEAIEVEKVNGWTWFSIIGGAISILGQFWGTNYYLPLIGGLIAVLSGFIIFAK